MHMMHARDGGHRGYHRVGDLPRRQAARRLLEEHRHDVREVPQRAVRDDPRDGDRQGGVDDGPARDPDGERADEHGGPAEDVLQHVQAHGALVQRPAAARPPGRDAVHDDAEDGEQEHPVMVDLPGGGEARQRAGEHGAGAGE